MLLPPSTHSHTHVHVQNYNIEWKAVIYKYINYKGMLTGYRPDDWMIGVDCQWEVGSFQHNVQTGSGAHPASYPWG